MDTSKQRKNTRIASYVVGYRSDTVLLAKRQNVEHMNGMWSLVAGHIYEGESATVGMIREFEEECGILLKKEELKPIGVLHSNSGGFDYVNFIYLVDMTGKAVENKETHKCAELRYHPVDNLPKPMEEYVKNIIKRSFKGDVWIAEAGW